ncbi:DNA repair protein RecO [Candidatus Gottesmanbacteria bacterium]|nr:DNA repair protein RecO [Candidatus Gottesmanbacteria bacterium]
MLNSSKVEGIVLARRNFSEADKIITLFTREQGKIKVVAKGIRRIKSRRAPHLELFNHVFLVLRKGKTFDLITEAKTLSKIEVDLKTAAYLFYLCEVLDKILPEHQLHEEIFDNLISLLCHPELVSGSPVKNFVIQLLWNLGYLPKGQYPKLGVTSFVETIVERKIRSKKFLEEL